MFSVNIKLPSQKIKVIICVLIRCKINFNSKVNLYQYTVKICPTLMKIEFEIYRT